MLKISVLVATKTTGNGLTSYKKKKKKECLVLISANVTGYSPEFSLKLSSSVSFHSFRTQTYTRTEVTSLAALLPPTPQPPDRDVACFVHMSICYVAYDTYKP